MSLPRRCWPGSGWTLGWRTTNEPDRLVPRLLLVAAVGAVLACGAAWGFFTLFADRFIASGRAYMEANWGTPFFSRPLAEYYALVEQRQAIKLALYNPLATPIMFLPVWVALLWGISRLRLLRLRHVPGRAAQCSSWR